MQATLSAMKKQLILGKHIGAKDTDGQKVTCKSASRMHSKF